MGTTIPACCTPVDSLKGQLMMRSITVLAAGSMPAGVATAQTPTGGFTGHVGPGPGGFTGHVTDVTVEHAKTLKDDSKVTLRGHIERHLGGEKYIFRDASGAVDMEVDSDHWAGQTVSPQDAVEVFGEVEKKRNAVEIDVKRLQKL